MTEELKVELTATLDKFNSRMDSALSKVKDMGKKMRKAGKKMTVAITAPLALIGGKALTNFDKQIQAEQRLAAAMRATGQDAVKGLADFKSYASGLQEITTVGDESTLELLSVATNMGLSAEQAKVAAKEAIALSKAMGMNEKSAIRYTAALADGDSTMLNRYLPTLRQIEDDTERAAKAHELLENMFGAATSEAENGLGPLRQLSNQFGDLLEEMGAVIADGIRPLINHAKSVVTYFQQMDDATKANIVRFAALAAAIGPFLVIAGTVLPAMATGFALLTSPITAVIAAVAALAAGILYVWDNWAAIQERISDVGWWRNAIIEMVQFLVKYNPLQLLIEPFHELLKVLGIDLPNPFDTINKGLEDLKVETKNYQNDFGSFTDAIKNAGKSALEALVPINKQTKENAEETNNATDEVKKLGNGIKTMPKMEIANEGDLEKDVELLGLTNAEMTKFTQKADQAFARKGTWQAHVEGIRMMEERMRVLNHNMSNAVNTIGQGFTSAFQGMIEGAKKPFEQFGKMIKSMITRIISAIAVAAILSTLVGAIFGGGSGIAKSMSFGNLFSQFSGGFELPEFASGGIVSGPTVGLMGEYSGARSNPEVIAPLDRLQNMMGGVNSGSQTVRVEGRISGQDILLAEERSANRRQRRRGY